MDKVYPFKSTRTLSKEKERMMEFAKAISAAAAESMKTGEPAYAGDIMGRKLYVTVERENENTTD